MEKAEVTILLSEENTLGDVAGPATSTSLDTLQFKHDFFEVLEELQLRRQEDEEHKKKLQEILKDKYELEKKLEDSYMANSQLVEKYKMEQDEIRHSCEEKMRTLQEEKAKASITSSCEDGQLSKLKDEIRALQLHKYNLEKTINEQEHKLHLQTSSHEQFLLLVRQLEEKCTTLSQQVVEVNENFDLLSNNVNEAIAINGKLERKQIHHNCIVLSYQDELATTKKELLRVSTKLSIDQQANGGVSSDNSHVKDVEQQLRMQKDLTALLEKQIEGLQKENASVAGALKESSSLLERQAESYEQTKSKNVSLLEQLTAMKHHNETQSTVLAKKGDKIAQLEQKYQEEKDVQSKKFADMEQRLRGLQGDFMALQQSYESLQCEKHQWLKEKTEYTATVADKVEKITLLEQQLNNSKPIISTSKSPELVKKMVSVEVSGDDLLDNKRTRREDDLPSNKRVCLSPSNDHDLIAPLPSIVHDSPAMPVPSSSHDSPITSSPQLSSRDVHASLCDHPATPLQSNTNDSVSSPSSHDLLATPPGSHPSLHDAPTVPLQPNPIDLVPAHPISHDSAATPPSLHDASIKSPSDSHDTTVPTCLEKCDSLPCNDNSPIRLPLPDSALSPLLATEQQDLLEFSDPINDIINTQLNQQITRVQYFLNADKPK